ncbi:MAG: DUF4350 domain-containing protein [Thermoprotei archaeon]
MRTALGLGVALFVVVAVAVAAYMPSTDPFSPYNPYGDGLSVASSALGVSVLSTPASLASVSPVGSALLVVSPNVQPTSSELASLGRFVGAGGRLVVAGDSPVALSIVRGLGLNVSFGGGGHVVDPLLNYGSPSLPEAFGVGNTTIVVFDALPIVGGPLVVLARTSVFSYTSNAPQSGGGPFVVAVGFRIGLGEVVFVSTPYVFANAYFEQNKGFIGLLVHGVDRVFFAFWFERPTPFDVYRVWYLGFRGVLDRLDVELGVLLVVGLVIMKVKPKRVLAVGSQRVY